MLNINTSNKLLARNNLEEFLYPRNTFYPISESYVLAGEILYKSNQDKTTHVWHCYFQNPNFIVERVDDPVNTRIILFQREGVIQQLDFSFDQNMSPVVFFSMDNTDYMWTLLFGIEVFSKGCYPKIDLDHKKKEQTSESDLLIFFSSKGKLYYAIQRENYKNTYQINTSTTCSLVYRIGLNKYQNKFCVYWR